MNRVENAMGDDEYIFAQKAKLNCEILTFCAFDTLLFLSQDMDGNRHEANDNDTISRQVQIQ